MKTNAVKKYLNVIYPLLSLGLFVLVWFVIAKIIDLEILLPSPVSGFSRLGNIFVTPEFWTAVGSTLRRTLVSFSISLSLAILFAVLSSLFKPVYFLLSPIVIITRAVPTMSVILLSLIWFTSNITPMFIAFLIIFPMLYASFYSAISNIDYDFIQMSKVYNVSKKDMAIRFFIPYIMPTFLDTIRTALSLNVKLVIAAEVLAQTKESMGVMMQRSSIFLDTPTLIAWTIAAIILSYLLEIVVKTIKRFVVRWR